VPPLGELNPSQVQQVLGTQHVARLSWASARDGTAALAVKYALAENGDLWLEPTEAVGARLPQSDTRVQFEVDAVDSALRWSAVIGWGFCAKAEGAGYRIHLTALRGFRRP
jgi:hypothetical protein